MAEQEVRIPDTRAPEPPSDIIYTSNQQARVNRPSENQQPPRVTATEIPPAETASILSQPPEQQSNPEPSTSTSSQGIREIIEGLYPLPKLSFKRPRTRKIESAAVLTSSPYKAKHTKKNSSEKQSNNQKRKRRLGKGKRKNEHIKDSSDEEEDWPCLICCELDHEKSGSVSVVPSLGSRAMYHRICLIYLPKL